MRKPFKRSSNKKGPVRAKKVSYDGIDFASGLEKHMYVALKEAKIKSKYEGETFVLHAGFHFENVSSLVQSFRNIRELETFKPIGSFRS